VQVAAELADRVDPDLVAERLEHIEIGVRAPFDPAAVAEHDAGELVRGPAFPDSGRAVKEIRVRDPIREGGPQQALRLVLLR
jgi:hypothetical protein